MTRVPVASSTPSPTASTTPHTSWPATNGSGGLKG